MKKDTSYLVMEVHSAYAVLLSDDGRFIKAANHGYQTGDVVTNIIPLKYPDEKKRQHRHIIAFAASIAACISLLVFGVYEYQYIFQPYGTVQMQINPEIELTLSRSGRVLDLNGRNSDGKTLIDGYEYKGKDKETVTSELTALAIQKDFLSEGGQILLLADSDNKDWNSQTEKELLTYLNNYLKDKSITIEIVAELPDEDAEQTLTEPQTITIPAPDTPEPAENTPSGNTQPETPSSQPVQQPSSSNNDSNYQNDNSGNSNYGNDNSNDSGYEADTDGNSSYED